MNIEELHPLIIGKDELILITGASGFVGAKVVEKLREMGFCNLRCIIRPGSEIAGIEALRSRFCDRSSIELVKGNLLSRNDCAAVMKDTAVVFHLATGRDGKSYPDAFMNSVVTTRNLLEASLQYRSLKRFTNISSFTVYTNVQKPCGRVLDENCPVEKQPHFRGDAYCFAKAKQDEIVAEYGDRFGIPYVIVRPGYVLGPGKANISSRVGIDTFGIFLHLGGSNSIPFTYLDNCAEAIVLAGLQKGVDGEVFNVVDDDLPTSRRFLRLYKKKVRKFSSIYIPHAVSYILCCFWERYSARSGGQLPPVFNRRYWHAFLKKTYYSNEKLKTHLGWVPKVPMAQALSRYFDDCRNRVPDA